MSQQKPRVQNELAAAALFSDALISGEAVRALTGVGRSLLCQLVKEGRFPAPAVRRNRMTRYRAGDVLKWLADQVPAEA